jgi:hypothetical protein
VRLKPATIGFNIRRSFFAAFDERIGDLWQDLKNIWFPA